MRRLLPCSVHLSRKMPVNPDIVCVIDRAHMPAELSNEFNEHRAFDKAFETTVSCFKSSKLNLPVVYAPVQDSGDYEDVRCYQNAARQSLQRAIKAGFDRIVLCVPESPKFPNANLCSILGALEEIYVPIQLREDVPNNSQRVSSLVLLISDSTSDAILEDALALESGRFLARDIGVGDPERMTAIRIEEYVKSVITDLKINVISDVNILIKEYPLFAAVNRAANNIPRHQGRIVFLEYKPPKKARKTLLLVGKGVTYDTGGADIKAGGVMAGMSRDKCGAAAVAGFMQIVQAKKPEDIHVIGVLCLVRNSVGEDAYVSDEVITSRAGVRIRVGNTDAEGRMAMADALCRLKELAVTKNLADPHLFTIATLTGHACLAAGENYSIAIDNSVARVTGHAQKLQEIGQQFGDPFEVSVLRKDDFEFNKGKVIGEDIVQSNNAPSVRTPRGHQIPAAFLIQATGLDKHGLNSEVPLKYTHLDIASSAGEHPKMPTAAPIVALVKAHLD